MILINKYKTIKRPRHTVKCFETLIKKKKAIDRKITKIYVMRNNFKIDCEIPSFL